MKIIQGSKKPPEKQIERIEMAQYSDKQKNLQLGVEFVLVGEVGANMRIYQGTL